MKKSIVGGIIFAIIAIFVMPQSLSAEKMVNWTWKRYKLKFKLPKSWKVTKNTNTTFIAKGGGVVFKIGPFRDRSATPKSTAQKALRTYTVIKNKRIMNQKSMRSKGGLRKYLIFGKAKYALSRPAGMRGKPVTFGIIGMINPNTVDALYVRTWWWAGKSNSSRNSSLTYKVANSFGAMK